MAKTPKHRIGAMEVLGICGFALALGAIVAHFLLFFDLYPIPITAFERCLIKGFQLIGVVAGLLIIRLFAHMLQTEAHYRRTLMVSSTFLALSLLALSMSLGGADIPLPIFVVLSLMAGLGSAYIIVYWLDMCSRVRIHRSALFTGAAFGGCGLFILLLQLIEPVFQPLLCIVAVIGNMGLLLFVEGRSLEAVPAIVPRREYLRFNREIEPSFFVFGIVFGIAAAFLVSGAAKVAPYGVVALLIGAGAAVVAALVSGRVVDDVTVLQRVVACSLTIICAALVLGIGEIRLLCFCLIAVIWAFFTALDYALLVRRSVRRGLFVFWNIPTLLMVKPIGMIVGMLFAGLFLVEGNASLLSLVMLVVVVIMDVIMIALMPIRGHHNDWADSDFSGAGGDTLTFDSGEEATGKETSMPHTPVAGEEFKLRCQALSELYRLSPREHETLLYLAKGRNTAYIQNKLVLSSNTVKTYIYSIYRKMDIHSQQQLIDLVEDCTLR